MVGAYGEWAAQKMQDPPRLPFRQANYSGVETWRPIARARFREPLLGSALPVRSMTGRISSLSICRKKRLNGLIAGSTANRVEPRCHQFPSVPNCSNRASLPVSIWQSMYALRATPAASLASRPTGQYIDSVIFALLMWQRPLAP